MRKNIEKGSPNVDQGKNPEDLAERKIILDGQNNWSDEAAFVRALRKGDEDAYRFLYRTFAPKIGAFAKGYLGTDDVDDVVQEVVLRVFKGVRKFRGESRLSTWIYKITLNVCNDLYKKLRNKESLLELSDTYDDAGAQMQFPSEDDVRKNVFEEVLYERLRVVIGRLSPEDRALLYMKEIDGLTYEEISEILGKPEGTLKSRLHYIKDRIKKELKEEVHHE